MSFWWQLAQLASCFCWGGFDPTYHGFIGVYTLQSKSSLLEKLQYKPKRPKRKGSLFSKPYFSRGELLNFKTQI